MWPPAGDVRESYLNEEVLFYCWYSFTIHQSLVAVLPATVGIKQGTWLKEQALFNIIVATLENLQLFMQQWVTVVKRCENVQV